MALTIHQTIWDSEEEYINETFWRIHPMFVLVQEGKTEELKKSLNIQLDRYDFRQRISKNEQKQREYMAVSLVNTFMIAGIQGGIYPPEANWIADQALRKLITIRKPSDIPPIISDAAIQLCEKVTEAKRSDTGNAHVENAKHYILTHLTQELTSEKIASSVGVSKYHLSRLFKSLVGVTMMEYLQNERIATAKQLLETTDSSIPQIATLLHFCDQSHFTLAFRRKVAKPRQSIAICKEDDHITA